MKNKSCELDILQIHLVKDMLLACLDVITMIVNLSLTEGQFCMKIEDSYSQTFVQESRLGA